MKTTTPYARAQGAVFNLHRRYDQIDSLPRLILFFLPMMVPFVLVVLAQTLWQLGTAILVSGVIWFPALLTRMWYLQQCKRGARGE